MISQIRKLIQDKLISGVNIKTINGSSVLGSGNLTVTGTVSDGDKGDITVSSSGTVWNIDAATVGVTELSATGTANNTTFLRGDNTWATPTASVADGDKGDITVSSSGTVWTIDNNAVTNAKINDVDWSKVTGEPTTLGGYGISDTKANFDAACSNGDFLFVGDITQYTDEMAQDAVGAMVANSTFINLTYVDATPSLTPALSATGTANNTTFLRGDNTWAAPTDPAGWTTIVKSANQDVTNSAPIDDTEFQFSIVAGGHYMIDGTIAYSGNNTTGDYAFNFTATAGTLTGRITYQSITTANAALNGTATITALLPLGVTNANIDSMENLRFLASFHASANATLKFQFGNSSAGVGRTSRTWKGSILQYKRLD